MSYNANGAESLIDLIMATLGSARSTYLFRSILRERKLKRHKKESIKATLFRLRSKGYAEKSSEGWSITPKGKLFLNNKKTRQLMGYLESPFQKNSSNHIIISFDIPEKNRILRNWLRNQIKIFGYKMLQQSLWIGPGPLPAAFIKRLENLNIRKNIKTFRITKGGN